MAAPGLSAGRRRFGDDENLRAGLLTLLPVALTVGSVLPFVALAGLNAGYAVLAGAVSLSSARFDRRSGPGSWTRLWRIPVIVTVIALIGFLLNDFEPVGDLAVVATYGWALLTRRFGPVVAAAGRAVLLPLLAMFMTPVPVGGNPLVTLALVIAVCLVAAAWSLGLDRLLPPTGLDTRRLRRAVTRARPRRDDVRAAALALDGRLPEDHPARLDVVRVQVAVDRGEDPGPALDVLDACLAVLDSSLADVKAVPRDRPARPARLARPARRRPSSSAITRLAVQGTVALALGLAAGQLLFPRHWTWTAVTVLTLTVGARARGDVVLRGVQRLGGAAAGTVLSALVVEIVGGHRALAVAVMLLVLALGIVLRDVGYAYWALCLTTVLGLLYGVLGQASGFSVLGERLLAVLVGAVCAVLPAYFIRPILTRSLARRRAADWLAAVRSLLDPEAGEPLVSRLRAVEAASVQLDDVTPAMRLATRLHPGRHATEIGWATSVSRASPIARRVVVKDPDAVAELRRAYARVGRSVRDLKR